MTRLLFSVGFAALLAMTTAEAAELPDPIKQAGTLRLTVNSTYAPMEYRGPFGVIPTRTPGVHFTELIPKIASRSHRFSLVRTHVTTAPGHPDVHRARRSVRPSLGWGRGPDVGE
jgi:ABC-type amino acid transport substrate-binding protein